MVDADRAALFLDAAFLAAAFFEPLDLVEVEVVEVGEVAEVFFTAFFRSLVRFVADAVFLVAAGVAVFLAAVFFAAAFLAAVFFDADDEEAAVFLAEAFERERDEDADAAFFFAAAMSSPVVSAFVSAGLYPNGPPAGRVCVRSTEVTSDQSTAPTTARTITIGSSA